MKAIRLFFLVWVPFTGLAQQYDSLNTNITLPSSISRLAVYQKPKPFSFITNIPRDVARFSSQSFKRKNFSTLALVAGSTALLLLTDQAINNTVHDVLDDHRVVSTERFSPIFQLNVGGKKTNFGKIPKNINTAFYDLGQGSSAMFMAAGFFIIGKIKKDNRALQTASQLTEAFIALGLGTQVMKYVTGRENPSDATARGGRWRPFPKWSDFQNNKTKYDAFPSGHLATFVSAITIISHNYPEKRWIGPLGYSIAGLCGLAMINNGVHWASDFPLGFALGYGFGKFISKRSHFTIIP